MNPRTLTRADLANFGIAAANAIAAGKVSGFAPDQALEISTAVLNKAQSLATANEKAVVSLSQYHTDTADAQGERLDLLNLLSAGKFAMRGVNATADQYAAVGFKPPADPSAVTPQAPTELAATGQSNSVTKLRFKGITSPARSPTFRSHPRRRDGLVHHRHHRQTVLQTRKRHPRPRLPIPGPRPGRQRQTSDWSNTAAVYETLRK